MNRDDQVFVLRPPDWRFTGTPSGILPIVVCEFCGQRVGSQAELPLTPPEPFKEWLSPFDKLPYREFTWTQFLEVRRVGEPYFSRSAELVPGKCIGPFKVEHLGYPEAVLKDIEFASPGGFLFSQELLSKLHERGIDIPNQRMIVTDRRERPKEFGLIHLDSFRIYLHPTSLETFSLRQCNRCGSVCPECPSARPPKIVCLERRSKEIVGDVFLFSGGAAVHLSRRAFEILTEINPTGFSATLTAYWA
jgi:hypothetical protein